MDNVINIEEFKITRKRKFEHGICDHANITLDPSGDIVECNKCKKQISAFSALSAYVEHYVRAMEKVQRRWKELNDLDESKVVLKAALNFQKQWRSHNMVPCCPHCHRGIFAGESGGSVSKDMEIQIRAFEGKNKNQ